MNGTTHEVTFPRSTRLECLLAHALFAWLHRRGWLVWLNDPDECTNRVERPDGSVVDAGWRPYFSVRYGHTRVYRAPGTERCVVRERS